MKKILIEILHPPFGPENTFAGIFAATASLSKGMDVTVILREDGVYSGRKKTIETNENLHLPIIDKQINDVLELDGRIVADINSMKSRGIKNDELIEGIEIVDSDEIHDLFLEYGDHVVTF